MRSLKLLISAVLALSVVTAIAAPALAAVRFSKIQYESPGVDTGSNSSLNGEYVTIHTGKGTNTRTDLYWGRSGYVWGDDSDTAYLYKAAGALADRCHYVSTTQQTSPAARC
jgi:hypothetical protein